MSKYFSSIPHRNGTEDRLFVLFAKIFQHFTIDFHIFGIFFGNFIPHHAHIIIIGMTHPQRSERKTIFEAKRTRSIVISMQISDNKKNYFLSEANTIVRFFKRKPKKRKGSIVNYRSFCHS
jgi:hypothetical protein